MATVLVLEPDAEVRELLLRQLARMGHHGVASADDASVDAIVVECADAGSFDRARRLRLDRPSLPTVCASVDEDQTRARALGADEFLIKPFGFEELQRALDAALRSASSRA